MSEISVNSILDASGGDTTTINGFTPTVSNMAGRNLIINGDMRISQRGTSATGVTVSGYYTVDRWNFLHDTGTYTITQESDGPSGFDKSVKIACTSTGGGTGSQILRHRLEGQHTYFLAYGTSDAKPTTLSFWVKSNVVETFSIGIIQHDTIQRGSYHNYTIASADTWQKVTVNIPSDPNGASISSTGMVISVDFFLNGTSGGSTPDGSWGARVTTNNADGKITTSGNYWQVTGVQLEAGSVATPFEHRMYGQELALCQRYYYQFSNSGLSDNVRAYSPYSPASYTSLPNSSAAMPMYFPVTMRAAPTVSGTPTAGSLNRATSTTGLVVFQWASTVANSVYGVSAYTATAEL